MLSFFARPNPNSLATRVTVPDLELTNADVIRPLCRVAALGTLQLQPLAVFPRLGSTRHPSIRFLICRSFLLLCFSAQLVCYFLFNLGLLVARGHFAFPAW